MNYKSVIITKKGAPDVLKIVENPLRLPRFDEVRVKVLYTGVGFTDVIMRYGYYAYAPKIPFAPGYEIIGIIDAVGEKVIGVSVGQRVAALTVYGGYAEYIYLPPTELIPAPANLDAVETLSLILNYATAYQMLHRVARVQAGQTVLITGASGGVGNALLQLGKLAGLKRMYGIASEKKRALVEQLGGIPVDYRNENITEFIQSREPQGVDAVFDAIGARSAWSGYRTLRRGGILVSFGMTTAVQHGAANNLSTLFGFLLPGILNILPDGRRAVFYGITMLYRKDPKLFRDDLPKLFQLLTEGKIKPVISDVLPLAEAARANEMLERGEARGKLALKCSSD
jgi:NADPH:quinone reductase-like Zn-dependent oxidoreductase